MYKMIYASTQGSDHIKHNMPCEDFGLVHETDLCSVFAVADGHGDSNCPRSQFGSETACRIAVAEMEKFCEDIGNNEWDSRLLTEGKDSEGLVRQLVTSIVAKWVKTVNEDLISAPLTETEKAGCGRYLERYEKGERLEHIYGTTLIAALLSESYLLLIQQGDGRCVVFDRKGTVSQPIPWDDRCFANVTTSLCDEDAIQSFRYCLIDLDKTGVIACMAGSDGVEDSFPSMDMMHVFYRDLLIYAAENGTEALNEYLAENLPEFSRKGSGDDVTICGIIDPELIAGCIPAFQHDNEIIERENALRGLRERLQSMSGMGKLEALKKHYDEALESISEAERSLEEAVNTLDLYNEDLRRMNQDETDGLENLKIWIRLFDSIFPGNRKAAFEKKVMELNEKKELAEQKLEQSRKALIPIEEEYYGYLTKKEELELKIEEAEQSLDELREAGEYAP